MRLNRARYVTICQQFLVTAVVVAVGLSAAGVMTLQIVTPEAQGRAEATDLAPAIRIGEAYADTAPVTPTVREVKVAPLRKTTAGTPATARTAGQARKATRVAAVSTPTTVHGYATVGVTWKHGTNLSEDQIKVQVRTRKDGDWSGWTTAAYHDEHGPDPGTPEAAKVRPGTDAVVVGDVDQVQMRAETQDGTAPADLELAIVDPGAGKVSKQAPAIDTADLPASDRDASSGDDAADSSGAAALAAMKVAPKPLIYSRAQWGANENLRDKSSLRYGTVKAGFIHHTVNANNYTPEQVPALIRGIYAYHTQSRGWSDIGYNFLVDRFGRIWEGRYGGVDRAVVGAHTLGYNEYAFAMSAIGNFDIVQPPQVMLNAYARLFAWKLSLYNIRADASHLWVKDRYLYAINGHRDVGRTACPGKYLYAKIPSIRVAAQAIQNAAQSGTTPTPTDPVTLPLVPTPAGVPSPASTPMAAARQTVTTFQPRINLAGSAWPDLVTKSATGAIAVVPTGGMRGFGAPVLSTGPWARMSIITAVGDVTGDGRGDILAKNAKTGLSRVFPGLGGGRVSATPVAVTSAFQHSDQIIAAMDFNRDGRNDVLARDARTKGLYLYLGTGKGTFAAGRLLRARWLHPRTAVVGDLTGDGKADAVVVRSDRRMVLLPGLGGATSATAFGRGVVMSTLPSIPSAVFAAGDFSGDGRRDVSVVSGGLTTVYAGLGGAKLGQAWGPFRNLAGLSRVSSAQLGGTGAYDAVGRDAAGRLAVYLVNALSNVGAPLPTNLKVPGATQVLDVGDWDRNGTGDVIARDSDGARLVLWPGLGNGKFGRGRSLGLGWKNVTRLTAVGDVTGDGYPDLMGRFGETGATRIFPGAGNNAFKTPMYAPSSFRTFNQIGSVAWTPSGALFPSTADRSFVPLAGTDLATALRAANGRTAAIYDTYVGVGDVDGDGIADVLAREKGTGTLWLLPGKTSGGVWPRMWVANGFAGYQLIG